MINIGAYQVIILYSLSNKSLRNFIMTSGEQDELAALDTPRLATPVSFEEVPESKPHVRGRVGRPRGSGNKYGSGGRQIDPDALTDAVAAAGVNIRAEEEALAGDASLSVSRRQIHPNKFLKPQQLAWFMEKAMEEQGMSAGGFDPDLINLMSAACESYLAGIVTDSVILSRHRRRGMKAKRHSSISGTKSEVSRALRDIAVKQKMREEKRMQRRVTLGLEEEKKNEEVEEQTQTNLTASLMMSGSMKKRYSWMQTTSAGHNSLSSRGDNGIRYREARQEQGIALRDLLGAIEKRRMGVSSTIVKGYSKMRD